MAPKVEKSPPQAQQASASAKENVVGVGVEEYVGAVDAAAAAAGAARVAAAFLEPGCRVAEIVVGVARVFAGAGVAAVAIAIATP